MKIEAIRCAEDQEKSERREEISPGKLRKYIYVLPSGRKFKVVLDGGIEPFGTAARTM